MILTPIVLKNLSSFASKLIPEDTMQILNTLQVDSDTQGHIVVIGYGHLGQEIVKKLKEEHRNYVIIEHNMKYYKIGKDENEPIIFGNAASKTILKSVNIKKCSATIVAIDNPEKLHLICEVINDLIDNSKTIVKVGRPSEKKELEGLNLEHIIVEDEVLSKAIVEETRSCQLPIFKNI